jgi:putative PIN family toxin of toxin-antitoxin system
LLRVTADTNILISGLTFRGGKPFQILELARTGQINLSISEAMLAEMEDVLRRKFAWSDADIEEGRRRIRTMARTVKPAVQLNVVKNDPADNRIFGMRISGGIGLYRHGR